MQLLADRVDYWPRWAQLLHRLIRAYVRVWHSARWGRPTLPNTGPVILACNHISVLDPLLLIASNYRIISFIVAQEYYDKPLLRPFLDAVGCIPVKRDGRDHAALLRARTMLLEGRVIGLFPEGGLNRDAQAAQAGIAWLVQETQAPVIPARVSGATQMKNDVRTFLSRQRPYLRYGRPLHFKRDLKRQEILLEVMAAIEALE